MTLLVILSVLFLLPVSYADSPKEETPFNFIKAPNLLEQMQNDANLYVFDVRTEGEYVRGHIEGSQSLPLNDITQTRLNNIEGLSQESTIVTYCGCPHHLSGLAAQRLVAMNYRNVRVLEEGFWYWKEQDYPVLPAMSEISVSELSVAGQLVAENKPVSNIDIFLKHAETGQLEAAKTDESGNYLMHLHLYDYQDKDVFEIYVADLSGEPARTFIPGSDHETSVVVIY